MAPSVRIFARVCLFLLLATGGAKAADRFATPELPVSGAREAEKFQNPEPPKPPEPPVKNQNSGPLYGHSADHSKFEALKGPFADNFAVTKACQSCDTESEAHIKKSIHWTWDYVNPRTGQHLGKENVINNFCTNAKDNEGMCANCHIGNGVKAGEDYSFKKESSIDCLVCHDSTATYYRTPPTRGNAACAAVFEGLPPIDYAKVAQHVGLPGRDNCGTCHYNGGGGDGVKHGDLDSSLNKPSKALDVIWRRTG